MGRFKLGSTVINLFAKKMQLAWRNYAEWWENRSRHPLSRTHCSKEVETEAVDSAENTDQA